MSLTKSFDTKNMSKIILLPRLWLFSLYQSLRSVCMKSFVWIPTRGFRGCKNKTEIFKICFCVLSMKSKYVGVLRPVNRCGYIRATIKSRCVVFPTLSGFSCLQMNFEKAGSFKYRVEWSCYLKYIVSQWQALGRVLRRPVPLTVWSGYAI